MLKVASDEEIRKNCGVPWCMDHAGRSLAYPSTAIIETAGGFLLWFNLRRKRHTDEETRLVYIMVLVAKFDR